MTITNEKSFSKLEYLHRHMNGFPEVLRFYPEVRSICINGCISDGASFTETLAHAHTKQWNKGWVCLSRKELLQNNNILLHELAHLRTTHLDTEKEWHNKEFCQELIRLGGSLAANKDERSYYLNPVRRWMSDLIADCKYGFDFNEGKTL